jgi:hypothetical protein
MATRQRDESRLRILLTQECARLMAEDGVKDFLVAKRKAVSRLNISNKALLPSNVEIEQALLEYQRLFKSKEQANRLRILRQTALDAMHFFNRFRPRLVGSVLSGTAGPYSDVNLHLFADTPEEVVLFLLDNTIPFEDSERRLRLANGEYAYFPVFSFKAGDINVDLTVFNRKGEREAPRSPVDGRPMRRASFTQVQALLEETAY